MPKYYHFFYYLAVKIASHVHVDEIFAMTRKRENNKIKWQVHKKNMRLPLQFIMFFAQVKNWVHM